MEKLFSPSRAMDDLSLFERHLVPVLEVIAVLIDLIGIVIILFGFTVCAAAFVRRIVRGAGLSAPMSDLCEVRHNLAVYILTGVEFMVASDLVQTVVFHTVDDLLSVAFLVVIRTVISFFLARDEKNLSS